MATTCSCRNGSKLLADYVAFTGSGAAGGGLDELTTTWYFGAALIVLWLLSRVLENNFLLAIAGLAILAGPAVVSLLAKDKKLHHLTSKHRVRR